MKPRDQPEYALCQSHIPTSLGWKMHRGAPEKVCRFISLKSQWEPHLDWEGLIRILQGNGLLYWSTWVLMHLPQYGRPRQSRNDQQKGPFILRPFCGFWGNWIFILSSTAAITNIQHYNFPGGSESKESSAMQETWVLSLDQEDPLEKQMATHLSTLAWKIPWTEEPGRLQSMGSQRVRHDWATSLFFSLFRWLSCSQKRPSEVSVAPSALPLPWPKLCKVHVISAAEPKISDIKIYIYW